jgi:hypothetical protein
MRSLCLILVAGALAGCGYAPCGTVQLWTGTSRDARFDRDGDGYLDLIEGCGAMAGSNGANYRNGLSWLDLTMDLWDLKDAVAVSSDYLPTTVLVFRTELLSKGRVLDASMVGGGGWHKPDACGSACIATTWPVTDVRLEVLDGPLSTGDPEYVEWRLRWDVTVGNVSTTAPRGAQHFEGEDVVSFGAELMELKPGSYPGKPAP